MRICAALVESAFALHRATGERETCWRKRGVSLVSGINWRYRVIGLHLVCGQTVRRFTSAMSQCHARSWPTTLRCRCICASTSTPPHLHTPTHLHIYITSVHPHCHSFTSAFSFFLSTYLFSHLCTFTSSHAHICRSTSPPPHICTSISHLHIHTVTPSHPPSLSLFLHIFSLHMLNLISSQLLTE